MRRRILGKNGGVMLGVQLPRDMKDAINEIADEREVPTSVLVRTILRRWLNSQEQAADAERRAREASVWPISKPARVAGGAR